MKTIAIFYLIFAVISVLLEPSMFGKKREPYSFTHWILNTILNAPLIWLLIQVVTK